MWKDPFENKRLKKIIKKIFHTNLNKYVPIILLSLFQKKIKLMTSSITIVYVGKLFELKKILYWSEFSDGFPFYLQLY